MPGSVFTSPSSQNSNTFSENSHRSPQQRKEALRNVHVNVQTLTSQINTKTIETLESMMDEADCINQEGTIEDKIKDQGVVILDSQIMTISSHVLKKCTLSLSENMNCYVPDEFAEKIKHYVAGLPDTLAYDGLNWSLLSTTVMNYFKRTPSYTAILGTLRMMPKKEIVRRKIVRDKQAPTKRPENVITVEKTEDSVEQTVLQITKIIGHYQKQHKKPLDFFALVLHPTDFGKTIENIMHVSFLVKDNLIKISMDKDSVPQISKATKEEIAEAKANKKQKNIQNVLPFSMKHWKALVEAYDIQEPMINIAQTSSKKK